MLTNYRQFLRSPTYHDQNQPVRWGELAVFLLLYVVLGFALDPLIKALVNHLQLKHALQDPDTSLILVGVLVVPPIEEVVFRLWLRVDRGSLFAVAFLVLFVGILLLPISNLGAVLLIALSVLILVVTLMGSEADMERVVERHFGLFFYGSAVLFALTHITNYSPLSAQTLLFAPLLVLPQFLMGTVLGYIRVLLRYRLRNSFSRGDQCDPFCGHPFLPHLAQDLESFDGQKVESGYNRLPKASVNSTLILHRRP